MNPFCYTGGSGGIVSSFSFDFSRLANNNNNNNNNNNTNNNNSNNNNGTNDTPSSLENHHQQLQLIQQQQQQDKLNNSFTSLIPLPIKQHQQKQPLELNSLPKHILKEILKHLNDQYSSCSGSVKPQNPIFHNNCYSDLNTNGKDSGDKKPKKHLRNSSNNVNNQQQSSSTNNNNNNNNNNNSLSSSSTTTTTTTNNNNNNKNIIISSQSSTCVYLKDIIGLSLVCKLWAKCIVPVSISSFIKISNRKELLTVTKFMTEGIIKGGAVCTFTTIKFHCKKSQLEKLKYQQHQQEELNNPCYNSVSTGGINSRDYCSLLEKCGSIKSLIFGSGHQLTPSDLSVITGYLRDCTNITDLKLSSCFTNSNSFSTFCESLRYNQSLTALDISYNCLSKDSICALVQALKHNRTLSFLDLSFNGIGSNGIYLANMFKTNISLQSVFLIGNELDNDSVAAIAEALKKNVSITELSLSENSFDDETGQLIGEMLTYNKTIKSIDLSFNDLADCTIQGFSEAISCNNTLTTLNLSDCAMSVNEDAGIQFFQALQTNSTIQKLVLWSCDLSSLSVKEQLAHAIRVNTTITELSLGFNDLTSNDISILLHKGLKYNRTIKNLSFSNNYIDSVAGIMLANFIKENDTIQSLSLFDNRLDNIACIQFLIAICLNNTIQKLCLGSCRICPNLTDHLRRCLRFNSMISTNDSDSLPFPVSQKYRKNCILSKLNYLKTEFKKEQQGISPQSELGTILSQLLNTISQSINLIENNNNNNNNNHHHHHNSTNNNLLLNNHHNINSSCSDININSLNLNSSSPNIYINHPNSPINNNNDLINNSNSNILFKPTFQYKCQSPNQNSITTTSNNILNSPTKPNNNNNNNISINPNTSNRTNIFSNNINNLHQQTQHNQNQNQNQNINNNNNNNLLTNQFDPQQLFQDELLQLHSQLQFDVHNFVSQPPQQQQQLNQKSNGGFQFF